MWRAKDFLAVEVPANDIPFAVPIEALSGRVGPDFVRQLADRMGGAFERDAPDIGLMDDFAVLRGRWLDPAKVHPLIKEFYEHTTRFTLSVRPEWHRLYLPLFWLFRKLFAERVGQFNLPFDINEEKRGIETHIDTIDFNRDWITDLRGWVRTYAGTERTIYVGFYSALRLGQLGYVSVGFPLPNSNLTATLVPANVGSHDFILRTHNPEARFAGDYIVGLDEDTEKLTVFRIRGLREEIQLYVQNDRLFTNHRFYFLQRNFLTLFYTIERRATPTSERGVARDLLKSPTLTKVADPASH
jgi:hypothetical protein